MPSIQSLLQNRVVQASLGFVVIVLIGSVTYYLIESTPPTIVYAAVTTGNISQLITATGTVTPVQNPTLSFETGGQVATVDATVGEKVTAGTLLASLDTSVLQASLDAAQATLNQLEAGPRSVDVAGDQTAVTNAQQTLNDTYASYPLMLNSTLSKAEGAIYTETDPMFSMANPDEPTLSFNTNNYNNKITVDQERTTLTTQFSNLTAELAAASSTTTPAELESMTTDTMTVLNSELTFLNNLVTAINDYQIGTITTAQQTADLTAANGARDTVNGLITSLTSASQSIGSEQLAVQSAQDQLNQTTAGATPQAIEAQQAQVAGIEAQISQQEIIAPFNGTVSSVDIKPEDVVQANSQAISLVPSGNFEVDIYLSETDVTQLKTGDAANITLDAYGTGRIFPATVASIDTSPSTEPGTSGASAVTGYKVTLVFNNADPAISNGMTANATIDASSAQNTLLIPTSAVITTGTQEFVLEKEAQGLVEVPVTLGISNANSIQVLSGLSAGDQISAVGSQQ